MDNTLGHPIRTAAEADGMLDNLLDKYATGYNDTDDTFRRALHHYQFGKDD